jgi:hypothetical protein
MIPNISKNPESSLGKFFYFISNVQWMKGGCLWTNFIKDYVGDDVNNDISNDATYVICDKEFFPLGFLQKLLFHFILFFKFTVMATCNASLNNQ